MKMILHELGKVVIANVTAANFTTIILLYGSNGLEHGPIALYYETRLTRIVSCEQDGDTSKVKCFW